MQVKQRLKINAMVLAAAALGIVMMFLLALYHLNKADNLAKISGDIVLNSFERVTLSNDYLQHDNERAKAQWFARHEETARKLKSASKEFPPAEDKEVVAPMLKRHESIGKIFSAIVENRETDKATAEDAVLSQEVEGRLLSQLNRKVYEEVVFGRELLEASMKKRASVMRLAGIGIACMFVILLPAVTSNAWTTARTIADRVQRLHAGASAIGGGNLDQRIDIPGNDEFAELAGAFNAMTIKLKGSYHDLTKEIEERKRAEEAARRGEESLKLSENRLSLFIEYAPASLAMFDRQMRYLSYSRRWLHDYGLGERDLRGLSNYDVFPEIPENWKAIHQRALAGDVVRNECDRFDRADGSVQWLRWEVRPWHDATGAISGIVVFTEDITESKKAEADVLKLSEDIAARNVELEDLNRELEAFIYSVSHDLRAPLRTMAAFVGFLCEDYSGKLDVQAKEYLTRISRSSEKMSKLIEDLLDLSRLSRQEINRTEVDLSVMAASIISGLQEADPERGVEVCIQEGLAGSADPALAESVLVNLLGNAWKFTSKTAGARIEFGTIEKDGETVYYVRDNGAGFDPRHAEKMFQPFHRLHSIEEFEGTGIGLAIVERIIRRHKGKIWAEGEAGRGAAVYFTLG